MSTSFVAMISRVAFLSGVFIAFVAALARSACAIIRWRPFAPQSIWMLPRSIRVTWVTATITAAAWASSSWWLFVASARWRVAAVTLTVMMAWFWFQRHQRLLWSFSRWIRFIAVVFFITLILSVVNVGRFILRTSRSHFMQWRRSICQLTTCNIIN